MGFNPVDLALGNISAVNASNDKLRKENAKLRELLRETLIDVGDYAEKYGIEHSYDAVDAHLNERLRALGIETS